MLGKSERRGFPPLRLMVQLRHYLIKPFSQVARHRILIPRFASSNLARAVLVGVIIADGMDGG